MSTTMCNKCQSYLYDYLPNSLEKELDLAKQIRMQAIQLILPEFVNWILRLNTKLQESKVKDAHRTALQIARRGRKLHDYEFLIHTATFNFLKFAQPWILDEVNYMKMVVIEGGVVKGKDYKKVCTVAQDYLSCMIPRALLCLYDLHEDHVNPKGLYTDLGKLFKPKEKHSDTDTCIDKNDDYMKEILEDGEDLYF